MPSLSRIRVQWLALALAAFAASTAGAHQAPPPADNEPGERIAELGRLDFPTSTRNPAAQTAFVRGMLLLHLFEYPSAKEAFLEAQRLDPDFAMAYWGEAMSYTHPVWNQQDLAAARAALARLAPTAAARAAKAPTDREKAWLDAAEQLYGEGDKRSRDARFAEAMGTLAARFPGDDEAKLFHALGLLGKAQGERDLPDFLQAAQIAQSVYLRNPDHPGAAHYWIHGMDDPEHAAGALEAARSLSEIAPSAPHALHMTSHIFMALGMWDDVVRSNERAEKVVASQLAARGQPAFRCGHYSEWLEYGYFQRGQPDRALQVLADCERQGPEVVAWFRAHPGTRVLSAGTPEQLQSRITESTVTMRAMAAVESAGYAGAMIRQAAPAETDPIVAAPAWFARGLAQVTAGDAVGAAASLSALGRAVEAEVTIPRGPDYVDTTARNLQVMHGMLDGAIARARGDVDGALAKVRAAAAVQDAMPFDFGPPTTVKPPHELAGDILAAAGRHAEAEKEYMLALKSAPRRSLATSGLEHAQAAQRAAVQSPAR